MGLEALPCHFIKKGTSMLTITSMAEGKIRELMEEEPDTIRPARIRQGWRLSWVSIRDVL